MSHGNVKEMKPLTAAAAAAQDKMVLADNFGAEVKVGRRLYAMQTGLVFEVADIVPARYDAETGSRTSPPELVLRLRIPLNVPPDKDASKIPVVAMQGFISMVDPAEEARVRAMMAKIDDDKEAHGGK